MDNERLILFISLAICCIVSSVLVRFLQERSPNASKSIPRALQIPSIDAFPSTRTTPQLNDNNSSEQTLRTVHDYLHIIHKAVDDFEGLGHSHPTFLLGETVQSLQDRLDLAFS